MMRVVQSETESVSSYVDLIMKVVLLIGDENLSSCKLAARVLIAVGNVAALLSLMPSAHLM